MQSWILGGFVQGFWSLWGLVCLSFLIGNGVGKRSSATLRDDRGFGLIWCDIALPAVLAHSEIIRIPAMIMSIIGGVLIYGTIISFGMFFQEEQEF